MERFLEVILDVERQATSLEVEARRRADELERTFREGLAHLQDEALSTVRNDLDRSREENAAAVRADADAIDGQAGRDVAALEAAAGRIRQAAVSLVAAVLLPGDDAP